jgi:hypothetical protein
VSAAYNAAIGDDGCRPVYWGVGSTPARARADAAIWRTDADDMNVIRISRAQAESIRAGKVTL